MTNKNNKKNLTFEEGLIELENIVKMIEQNDIKLDELVNLYERSKFLMEFCQSKLDNAKMKIEKIENNS